MEKKIAQAKLMKADTLKFLVLTCHIDNILNIVPYSQVHYGS